MKKKWIAGLTAVAVLLSLGLSGCGSSEKTAATASSDKKVVIKVAYENNTGEPTDKGAREWARMVKEKSNGRLELQLFPSSQLGTKTDLIQQMLTGSNVITIADASFLMDYVPDIGILSGPYLADNYDQLFKLTKTDWFIEQEKKLEEKGLHIVTTNWIYGTRDIVAKKAITKPSDMQGLKIRVPGNQLFVETIKAMGGTPTPMAWGDTYTALTQGVVDGAENPISVLFGSKMYESAKFLSLTGHIDMISQWIAGQKFWKTLPADLQKTLVDCGEEAGIYTNKQVDIADKDAMDKMKAAGVTVVDSDKQAFRDAVKPVYQKFPKWTPGLYDKVQLLMKN